MAALDEARKKVREAYEAVLKGSYREPGPLLEMPHRPFGWNLLGFEKSTAVQTTIATVPA